MTPEEIREVKRQVVEEIAVILLGELNAMEQRILKALKVDR